MPSPAASAPDPAIQRVTQRALDRGIQRASSSGLAPSGGAAVVVDLKARAVVAVASTPDARRALRAYPAGSVVKPIVAIAALRSGIMGTRDLIPCPAVYRSRGATIHNWRRSGGELLTISAAIAQSCNTFFAAIADRLWESPDSRRAIEEAYRDFGFGRRTGLVTGEEAGLSPPPAPSAGDLMVLAIGQGPLLVTPIQVARAYAAIAGAWPLIPLDASVMAPVQHGLVETVRSGTARDAFEGLPLKEFPIAGKTGSAEIGDVTPYGWFAGYAPANHPRYVVVVVVERGRRGAQTAAPIARDVFTSILKIPRPSRAPFPPLAGLALIVPILAGFASPAAGSLIGFIAGFFAVALAGGSGAAGGIAFAAAGWLAGSLRRWPWIAVPVAAGAGIVAFPADGQPVWWLLARAAVTAGFCLVAVETTRRTVLSRR